MSSVGAKVKKFFAKKKSDAKFAKAGPGRKLTGDDGGSSSRDSKPKDKDAYVPIKRDDLTDEMKKARDAALERMNKTSNTPSFDLSLKAIKEKARKELEEEKVRKVENEMSNLKINEEPKQDENTIDINFTCSLISDEILPKKEWKQKIKDFLHEQLQLALSNSTDHLDPGITSCLIIKSCNPIERSQDCVETLKKYLSNIIQEPSEVKFHKIRMTNRIFCDKVANVEGSSEFLKNAGFSEQVIDGESFLVWSPETSIEHLLKQIEYLNECEPIQLELDRNIQVLLPSQNNQPSLSQDFFKLTAEELKREQTNKTSAVEDAMVLKTKAMREKEQERFVKKFKYSVIRVRFPDGLFLQGTFSVYEKLSNIYEFVASQLQHESAEFSLLSPDGVKFTDEDQGKTLYALRLVPNCILKFTYENESKSFNEYLKDEALMLVRPV
ncbi:hypothetical protein PVAND_005792 [Polypedilum vanderplanki]|uniref:UBX domain-containing protein n=1 Tax=Polypedilum vanderplanki TaxID=319348 RepID=A0A9J6C1L0_POLVA|nr:hypothetical protein PVAND_005792 [Polypedilum vanderplanki]